MKLFNIIVLTAWLTFCLGNYPLYAEQTAKDKIKFQEDKDVFLNKMKKDVGIEIVQEKKLVPKLDVTGYEYPKSADEFVKCWHTPRISQGMTGSCWCFSATSFFESEIYRLSKREIKLSEMYTIYWEYVEKADRFIETRGESLFSKGSQPNAVIRIWKKYGVVPASAFPGKRKNQKHYDHTKLFTEMESYLESVKAQNAWNKPAILATIKSILNHYIGIPPKQVIVDGVKMTPLEYLQNIVRLNLDDYQDVLSLKQEPYGKKVEYAVPDNWWHSNEYLNVPLDEFMQIIKVATRNGYSVCIVGDISESGYIPQRNIALVPSYDIPSEYIDENARQVRFSSRRTTDDHAVHLVGYLEQEGKDWYLIKDSGSSARNGKPHNRGYFFYHEDYVKLKMMNMLVHKDILNKSKIQSSYFK
ncbi:MAG: peptidase C1 [bacterium]|nr:peptidase C1 [bacterium]